MPRIVACGSRQDAYARFCTALLQGKHAAMLLVDSEEAVTAKLAWEHLSRQKGDEWARPANARDEDCHLMVPCMENWFLADAEALAAYFGRDFNPKALPAHAWNVEDIAKADVYRALAQATQACRTKGTYGKGRHSFDLLERIDPAKVTAASKRADCLVKGLVSRKG